jgi:hypothetical protein
MRIEKNGKQTRIHLKVYDILGKDDNSKINLDNEFIDNIQEITICVEEIGDGKYKRDVVEIWSTDTIDSGPANEPTSYSFRTSIDNGSELWLSEHDTWEDDEDDYEDTL